MKEKSCERDEGNAEGVIKMGKNNGDKESLKKEVDKIQDIDDEIKKKRASDGDENFQAKKKRRIILPVEDRTESVQTNSTLSSDCGKTTDDTKINKVTFVDEVCEKVTPADQSTTGTSAGNSEK